MKQLSMFFGKGIIIVILIAVIAQLEYKGKKLDVLLAGGIKSAITFFKGNPLQAAKQATKEKAKDVEQSGMKWLDEKTAETKALQETSSNTKADNLEDIKQEDIE